MTKYDQPVFVTNFPLEIKAFYMKLNEDGSIGTIDMCGGVEKI